MNKYYLILLCLTFFACKPENPELKRIENVKVSGLNLFSGTEKHISVKADAYFSNPLHIPLELDALEANFFINEKPIGKFRQEEKSKMSSKEEFALPLLFDFEVGELLDALDVNLVELIADPAIPYKIKGSMKAGYGKGKIKIPLSYTDTLRLLE